MDVQDYPGVTHEFFGMGAVVPAAKDAEDYAAQIGQRGDLRLGAVLASSISFLWAMHSQLLGERRGNCVRCAG